MKCLTTEQRLPKSTNFELKNIFLFIFCSDTFFPSQTNHAEWQLNFSRRKPRHRKSIEIQAWNQTQKGLHGNMSWNKNRISLGANLRDDGHLEKTEKRSSNIWIQKWTFAREASKRPSELKLTRELYFKLCLPTTNIWYI